MAATTPSAEGAIAIYYSVGTSVADLKAGTPMVTITAGIATFSVPQPANVGVGDEILYGAATAYISGRTSSTQYSVITRLGAAPGPVANVPVTSIKRAFNLLSDAESFSTNGSHLGTANLVTGNFQLSWPCYNDGVMNNSVRILGYTTDATHYIQVYTPTSSNEVGVSQRHSGVFGTGFQMNAPTNAHGIQATDNYVRIEGLAIQTTVTNNSFWVGIWADNAGTSDVRISNNIIKGVITGGVTGGPAGIEVGTVGAGQVYRLWNNVVYNYTASGWAISLDNGTVYVFDNTVFNSNRGIGKTPSVTGEVRNNVSINNALNAAFVDYFQLTGPPAVTRSANVSSDTTSETAALRNKTAYATYFRNTAPGTEDFHLKASSLSLWNGSGTDLSADANLPVTDDIEGDARVRPDIGADEFTATALFRSVGMTGTNLNTGPRTVTISGSTATFSGAMPDNVGVGDALTYNSGGSRLAFIHGRTSTTVFTVKDKAGGTPTAAPALTAVGVYRAYTSLALWESQNENTNINASVRDFDTSTDLAAAAAVMLVACYADGADTTAVTIAGWITGPETYISIFTPTLSSQVGASQRHSGAWDATKYQLVGSLGFNGLVGVQTAYVRVTGLQIENQANQANQPSGIEMDASAPSELRVSHNIVRATGPGVSDNWTAGLVHTNAGGVYKAWNNIIYDWGSGFYEDVQIALTDGSILYNNTIINSRVLGIHLASALAGSTYRVANNLVQGAATNYSVGGVAGGLDYSATNLAEDATSPQVALRNKTVTFVGAADYHLSPADTSAKNQGTDLSADPVLAVLDDIDDGVRQPPWDIGADESGAAGTADLAIAKTDGLASAVPGTSITYGITVTNNGPGTVTSLFVNDSLPALAGVSFTPSTGTYDSGTGEWTGLNLAATQSVVLTLAATIDPFARGNLLNGVTVSPPPGVTDPNGANDFASDMDGLNPSADVRVVKTDDFDPAPLGGLLTYTLTVTNNGPSGATGVNVSDPLPPDLDLDGAPGAMLPSQGTCNYISAARTVSCDLVNVAPGSNATVAIKVRPQAARLFSNTATTNRNETDPAPGNNSEDETTLVEVSSRDVRFFTATSTNQRNVLEWVNPTDANYLRTEIMVRGDAFPTGPTDPLATSLYDNNDGGSGGRWKIADDTPPLTNGQTYYYGAFVHRSSAPPVSAGRFVAGRPFDHSPGPVKWAFSTGATAMTPPTVGGGGVIATSNDKALYAMERGVDDDQLGVDSGEWPASFEPIDVGGPVQGRSPVVPINVGGANPVVFVGSQDGNVYAVDATLGGAVPYLWVAPVPPVMQAAPAGIFSAFFGSLDYLLVGTRDSALSAPNAFVALDLTGVEVDRYNNGGAGLGAIGIVNGMAAVDYGPPARVYFTSYERTGVGSATTLWGFALQPTPPVFTLLWPRALGNIDGSPVLRNGRVYVGSPNGTGTVYSIDAATGNFLLDRTFNHMNGQVKSFVFPDRASNDIYFATDDFVWGVTDTGAALMTNKFAGPISLPGGAKPSPVLFLPGDHYLYVGGSDGKLYEINVQPAVPVLKQVQLGNGLAVVGAPSLDRVYNLVHVGTEAGIFYAVQVPLP